MRRHKYGAVRVGQYASKAEAAYAAELGYRKLAPNGDVADWLEQVPIKLPGGITYRCDFLVLKRDGSHEFVEVKGFETKEWVLKRKLLEEARPHIAARLTVVRGSRRAK